MSGVPIGILIAVIIMIVPIYKTLRANHVLFKYRVAWLLVTAFGIAGGLLMGIVQMQAIQEAATAQARARALIGMSPWPNIIVIFSPLAAYIGLRTVHKKPKAEGRTSVTWTIR